MQKAGGTTLARRAGVRAARHLRLPDRPHPRDGGREGASRSTRTASAASWPSSATAPRPTRAPARPAWCRHTSTARSWTRAGVTAVHRLRRGRHRGARCAACSSTARASAAPARATRSRSSSTAPRSTPRAAASSPTPGSSRSPTARVLEIDDVQQPVPGLYVHRGRVASRRGGRRASRVVGARRPRAPARHLARAHRDAPRAQGVPRGAGRDRHPDGVGELARAGSGSTSRRPRAVPASVLADVEARVNDVLAEDLAVHAEVHVAGRGARGRRDGAVRREVRRPRARGVRGRLGARALRRHPRRSAPARSAW